MSRLKILIEKISRWISDGNSHIKYIRDPNGLLSSLVELNNLIGNPRVKDSTAGQVMHLIKHKKKVAEGKVKNDGCMLNTLLYGGPGVGKSLIGTKLAKIFYTLGYLPEIKKRKNGERASLPGIADQQMDLSEIYPGPILYAIVAAFLIVVGIALWKMYNNFGMWATIIIIISFVVLTIAIVLYLTMGASGDDKDLPHGVVDGLEVKQGVENTSQNSVDDSIIVVVSRESFVDKYVGWTDKKTLKLLNSCRGKVLFIDEAYSLCTGPDDQYGAEAITALNLFVSQNPDDIIIIMGGYEDMLRAGPFAVQPGLYRRFMWHFECEGYTIDELFEVFKKQLHDKGWSLRDERECLNIFRQNGDAFPFYGGDTERLRFLSELEDSYKHLRVDSDEDLEDSGVDSNVITPNMLRLAIDNLRRNNMKSRPEVESDNPMVNMMNMLRHEMGGRRNSRTA